MYILNMKTILTVLLLALNTLAISQSNNKVAYVTEHKDTLYVITNMYPLLSEVWNSEKYINEKPVIIKVDSVDKYYIKEDE